MYNGLIYYNTMSSARISKKEEWGYAFKYDIFSMPIPLLRGGGDNISKAVIVQAMTIGSGGEHPYSPGNGGIP